MNYLLIISMLLNSVAAVFSITRQFQMLQQNSYFPSRYTSWLKGNFPYLGVFAFFISSALFCLEHYYLQMIFIAFILGFSIFSAIILQKKSIKKLVFTGRIKRLYTAAIIVLLLLLAVYILLPKNIIGKIASVLLFLLSFITPALVYIAWAVTKPIENAFTKWYINDAKKILKNHPNLKVIGITGSYGKTTTKFILTRILSEKFNVVCTPQSFNTPMGVVRTIREMLKPQTEIFVCEMGAKNVGDIKEICDIVEPDLGMITSVGPQHLETFKSVDNVFNTKFELAEAVKAKGGKAFVNGDSNEIAKRISYGDFSVYGTDDKCDYKAENITYGKFGSLFEVTLGGEKLKLNSRLLGLHSIINITGAAAIAHSLGVSNEEIKFAVASLKPYEHRLEMKPSLNGSVMIDDAYNANPEGSIEAVRVLGSFDGMKKVIITPGLIELGEKEYECNRTLGLEAAGICDIIILVGKNRSKPLADGVNSTGFNKDNLFIASSFMEAMEIYSRFADNNTILLIENDLPDNYLN
ncbi:MAG: UDP-N-acetylmuramoyl-tripeptide--D-alanyl-D-alanine ligase [Ruminococcaceae bacterium]|nr:UDP-N-acetylmuramoyl-tripeptide--D-alanyl-D-alanine ligase [Oscillospiraceae bacterium]